MSSHLFSLSLVCDIDKFENETNQNKLIEVNEIMIAAVTCNGLRYFAKLDDLALVQFGAKSKLQL